MGCWDRVDSTSSYRKGAPWGATRGEGRGFVVTALAHPTPSPGRAGDVVEGTDRPGHRADIVENGHSVAACHLVASKDRISDGQL